MKSSSHLLSKIGLVLVLAGFFFLPSWPGDLAIERVEARIDGASRLVSVESMPMEGDACAYPYPPPAAQAPVFDENIPVNPVTVAMAMQQEKSGRPSALAMRPAALAMQQQPGITSSHPQGTIPVATGPDAAKKNAIAARKPIRTIKDLYPQFSALAVDSARDEVVMFDENLFQVMAYERTTNTPRTAAASEPKRSIRGPATYLELNCAIYIDPGTGNIYTINNDTERSMTVWDRNAKGNASPAWKLRAPMGAFGLAVDEERQELLITAQHEQIVAGFDKFAKDDDAPKWVLWGDKTRLADPHGIALDTKLNVFYVANFGSTSSPRPARAGENPLLVAVGRGNMIPGSGRFYPPSITVYDKAARGDTAPIREIAGPNTQLNWPVGLFIDSERGELYVANDGANSILVFSATANGNAAPIRVLKGPKTNLSYPSSVYVDLKNNELWVANFGNHRATVYQRAAAGDAAPIREIRTAPEGTPSPTLANARITYDPTRDQILAPN